MSKEYTNFSPVATKFIEVSKRYPGAVTLQGVALLILAREGKMDLTISIPELLADVAQLEKLIAIAIAHHKGARLAKEPLVSIETLQKIFTDYLEIAKALQNFGDHELPSIIADLEVYRGEIDGAEFARLMYLNELIKRKFFATRATQN